jgi:hypothetical protein
MGSMEMPLPDNTLPMATGEGPFGNIEMGGMFTTVKVRKEQKPGDYSDPGWYKHPKGTVAYEWTGDVPAATKAPEASPAAAGVDYRARKPQGHHH